MPRPVLRSSAACLAALAAFLPFGALAAQQATAPGPARPAPPVHAPQPHFPPSAALAHLRENAERARAAQAAGREAPPGPRPAAAGRYVAAVLCCADADVAVEQLFLLRRRDVLVMATPAATATADVAALLEDLAARERLSLVIVLTHAGCRSLDLDRPTPAGDALRRRTAPGRELAARRRLDLHHAQALLQVELLLAASPQLAARVGEDDLRIVPASVDPATLAVTWHTTRAEELPIAPVK